YLPAIVMVVVLLVWHVLRRDRWRLELPVLGAMALEAVAWTPPLVVLALVVQPALTDAVAAVAGAGPAAGASLTELSREARATIAVGAGLYEELLFRMVGVAL